MSKENERPGLSLRFIPPPRVESESNDTLAGIERLHERNIRLPVDGFKKVIDDQIVLAYVSDRSGEYDPNLLITREVPIGITVEKTGHEIYDPDLAKAGRVGEFVSTFIGLRPTRPRIFIGERYEIELTRRTSEGIEFVLRSTDDLHERTVSNEIDPKRLLKGLWERRSNPSSTSRRRERP